MVQVYPLCINVYKGEERLLVVCYVSHKSGLRIIADWSKCYSYDVNPQNIGGAVFEARTFIRNSPLSDKDLNQRGFNDIRKNHTKYKSMVSFWKNN